MKTTTYSRLPPHARFSQTPCSPLKSTQIEELGCDLTAGIKMPVMSTHSTLDQTDEAYFYNRAMIWEAAAPVVKGLVARAA